MHGPGVSTPRAATVSEAGTGLARLLHRPNGKMLTNGLLSMMFAAGMAPIIVRFCGMTTRFDGARPKVHISSAPLTTGILTAANVVASARRATCLTWGVPRASTSAREDLGDSWLQFAGCAVEHLAAQHRAVRTSLRPNQTDDEAGADPAVTAAALRKARATFARALKESTPFASIAGNARLGLADAELLAIIVGCELDMRLARLIA